MSVDPMIAARARLALREAARHHLSDPNVGLIDFGFPIRKGQVDENKQEIRFHVYQRYEGLALEAAIESGKTRDELPKRISVGGTEFNTNVVEGTYKPHQWGLWWRPSQSMPRATRNEPMRGGISISDEYHRAYGTLGGLVVDRASGAEMILSNWHVLVTEWSARPGQRIYQPGRLDGGVGADTVATLTRDAMSLNLDAAVATLTGARPLVNDQFELGPIRGVTQPTLGMEVVKSGRRTGITYGRVTGVDGIAQIKYGYLNRIIRHVVTIDPRSNFEEVSGSGDSGSLWLDTTTRRSVGLHFAGSNYPERGLALDMRAVLNALNVNLVIAG
ncbi:MAG: S1 family peptidase [Acidobacteria bacterium]|nr:S1 family peptidase [Acidobacteriota bacterium]